MSIDELNEAIIVTLRAQLAALKARVEGLEAVIHEAAKVALQWDRHHDAMYIYAQDLDELSRALAALDAGVGGEVGK